MQFIPVIERVGAPAADGTALWSSWRDRPLYTQEGDAVTSRSVSPAGYGRFLIDIFEEWVRHDVARVYVQMFDTTLANWAHKPLGMCVHCETCGLALALEHTGDVYSCDHFVELRYLLGNSGDRHLVDLTTSERQQQFGRNKRDTLPRYCKECDVRFICHGGCPKDRFTITPQGDPDLNYLCPSFKLFFHHVEQPMQTITELLAEDSPPAQIMGVRRSRSATRPQRALHVRQRAQVEALSREQPRPEITRDDVESQLIHAGPNPRLS